MSNHTHNWQVTSTVRFPSGKVERTVVFGRTRAIARRKANEQHADAPHGVQVRTTAPIKYFIV